MLQSAIFADLQASSFGTPFVRFVPPGSVLGWAKDSFSQLAAWLAGAGGSADATSLNAHLRRDIGLAD